MGKWIVLEGISGVRVENNKGTVCIVGGSTSKEAQMKNARMLAAAPELFDALEDVVQLLEMCGIQDNAPMNKAYAALAKAKGGKHG